MRLSAEQSPPVAARGAISVYYTDKAIELSASLIHAYYNRRAPIVAGGEGSSPAGGAPSTSYRKYTSHRSWHLRTSECETGTISLTDHYCPQEIRRPIDNL